MVIERVLPADVAAAEAFGELGEPLFPVEAAAVASAVERRRLEFATGRACARTALARLGFPRCAIPRGPGGAPVWPHGVVGSLTHCASYRAAAVAPSRRYVGLGIDAEVDAPLPPGVLDLVSVPQERECLGRLPPVDRDAGWDRVLFSAKEAVFKAWFPLTRAWLGFEDVVLGIDPDAGTFSAQLLVTGPEVRGVRIGRFDGRWVRQAGLVVTAVTVVA